MTTEHGHGPERTIIEAATGDPIATVPDATPEDVSAAVDHAHAAFREWRSMGTGDRASVLSAFADDLEAHSEELATLDARNVGNPIRAARGGIATGLRALRFFIGLSHRLVGETIPASPQHLHFTLREPFGVVGVITPFNHPSLYAIGRGAAALVAGNTVVMKPAHQAPLSALLVADIARHHLPDHVFQVVAGARDTGAALVREPRIRRLAFTGSIATALSMQGDAAASGVLKQFTFELGGKNPLIAMPDADPQRVAQAAVTGMSLTRVLGQSCGSTTRLFVHDSLHREVVERVAELMAGLRFGSPLDEATDMGSLVSEEQRVKVERYVSEGRTAGASLVMGGRRPTTPPFDRGFFYLPTLFDDVRPSMSIAQDEIFGPVLAVIPWRDKDAMVEAVNSTRYGLTASIFTNDVRNVLDLISAVEAGYVWVNDVEKRWVGVPFGGQKDSGIGTEYSKEELFSFTQGKTVSISIA